MTRLSVLLSTLAFAACSQGEPAAKFGDESARRSAASEPEAPSEPTRIAPPQSAASPAPLTTVDMSPTDSMPQCRAGLKAKGLNEAELDIMLGPMAGVCPNTGVTEGRIREILTTIWTQAGCHQHGPIEVARALDSGACGGDAG